jgi:broad specificity phosphatase PhoE
MTEILLIRHGETDWNAAEVFRGRIDVSLNERGIQQAGLLARYMDGLTLDAIYSSPLKRAWQTAEAIARMKGQQVEAAPGLLDFDFGEWQGLSRSEVQQKYPEAYADWLNRPERLRVPGGEDLGKVEERALPLVDGIIANGTARAALVTHRVVMKVIICALLGLDSSHFWNIKLDTCGISTFIHESGRFVLARHNDTSFLRSAGGRPSTDF